MYPSRGLPSPSEWSPVRAGLVGLRGRAYNIANETSEGSAVTGGWRQQAAVSAAEPEASRNSRLESGVTTAFGGFA